MEGNLGLAGIVIEPTPDLRRLQQRIIDESAPFTVENGTGEAFAPRPDGAAIGQATVDYVNTFVGPRTGMKYHPHLTVGIGTERSSWARSRRSRSSRSPSAQTP